MIKTKRVYEPVGKDGYRILVDRLWPRGLSKEKTEINLWLKEIAPTDSLRKWFAHKPERWKEFKKKYFKELKDKKDLIKKLKDKKNVTLVYAAKDEKHNDAIALKEYIKRRC